MPRKACGGFEIGEWHVLVAIRFFDSDDMLFVHDHFSVSNYKCFPPTTQVWVGKLSQLHPLVPPQVSHFRQVPLRTRVKLPHSRQFSPS